MTSYSFSKGVTAILDIQEYMMILLRIITIFPLVLFVNLFMGRRAIGEMPVFDFLIILALGSVVGADIADPDIKHFPTAFAILAIGFLQKCFSIGVIKWPWFGKLVTFEPIIVIYKGKLIYRQLNKVKYSMDNILHMLREEQIFDVKQVDLAILEANGKLSIMEKAGSTSKSSVAYPIVREGRLDANVLAALQIKELEVLEMIEPHNIPLSDIFLATINDNRELHISKYYEEDHQQLPPVYH